MKKIFFLFVFVFGMGYWGWGQTPYLMSSGDYSEAFTNIANPTNWPNGFNGTDCTEWGAVVVNATGTIPDGIKTTVSTSTFSTLTSGGVQRGTANIVLLSTGSTDNTSSCAIDLSLDFTGRTAGTISFDWAEVANSTGNRNSSLRIYTSTNGTTFTELTSAAVLNLTNNVASSGTISSIALPSTFNNSSTARIRFYEYNGTGGTTGSRAKISIDNVAVTSTAAIITAPTTQANSLTFSLVASSSFTASWTNGNGSSRAVFIKQANTGTAAPTDNTSYTANTTFGSGTQIGSTGWFCIYNGSGTTVSIIGLTASTDYIVHVCEYNGSAGSEKYNTSSATGNPATQTTNSGAVIPTITSPTATTITNNSAVLGGNITSDGGSSITERGTVWNTSPGVLITDNKLSEGNLTIGVFTHTRSSLPAKTLIYYKAYGTNSMGTSLTTESGFYTLANEPTSHVTGFTATAASTTSIDLSWSAAATGADGYLILQKAGAVAPTGTPTDATGYSVGNTIGDGIVAALVLSGSSLTQTISALSPSTQYSYTIIPYAWDGTNSQTYNYYTSPTIPSATATTNTPPLATYTWQGLNNGSWLTSTNWNPSRTVPYVTDILQFNDGTTKTITNVPTQTIGKISITGNTTINLQSGADAVLTIYGVTGTDLDIPPGNALNLNAANAITIAMSTGATAVIGGNMTFTTGAHRLTGADASSITFTNGSVFTAGTNFTGNAFGTGTANSVIFASGSAYIQQAGSNPFVNNPPASIVVFQAGSLYKLISSLTPSFSGKTYANFEMDVTGLPVTTTGGSAVTMDNLTITNGTLNFNMTGAPGHSIRGNITVATGGILNFDPASAGTVNLNGSSPQTISGGGTISFAANSTIAISNSAGVILNNDVGNSGALTVKGTGVLICDGSHTLSGNGSFTLSTGTTLITAHPSGLDGSITLSGSKSLSTSANYIFNGIFPQITGTSLPATVNNLTIDNAAGVSLSNTDLTVSGNLTINNGKLFNVGSDQQVTVNGTTYLK